MEIFKDFIVFPITNNRKFVFLSTSDDVKSFEIDIDWTFPVNNSKPKMFLPCGIEESEETGNKIEKEGTGLSIQFIAVSEAGNWLSFTASDKSLFLCEIRNGGADIKSRRMHMRGASTLRFSSCGKILFLADKTGDIFEFSCVEQNKPGRWIFGHISQILDLQINFKLGLIVSTDRDEKIRVSNYPTTHDIHTFLIGHTEFVSSCAFLNNDKFLISASGDKTLRLWDVSTGKQIQLINMSFIPITILLSERFMAISNNDNTVYVYSYKIEDSTVIKMQLLNRKNYESNFLFTVRGNTFYILHFQNINEKSKLCIDKFASTAESPSFEFLCDVNHLMNLELDTYKIIKPFDVSLLFKKKYDNTQPYIERKKARI